MRLNWIKERPCKVDYVRPIQVQIFGRTGVNLPAYRLYLVRAGRFHRVEEFEADDHGIAVSRARDLRGDHPAELWSGRSLVHSFAGGLPPSSRWTGGPASEADSAAD